MKVSGCDKVQAHEDQFLQGHGKHAGPVKSDVHHDGVFERVAMRSM